MKAIRRGTCFIVACLLTACSSHPGTGDKKSHQIYCAAFPDIPAGPPVKYNKIISEYGCRDKFPFGSADINPQFERHKAVLLSVGEDARVRAAASGTATIRREKSRRDDHLTITIKHKGDWKTVYRFTGESSLADGARIERGDLLGHVKMEFIGKTLHYEIRRREEALDPTPFLKPADEDCEGLTRLKPEPIKCDTRMPNEA